MEIKQALPRTIEELIAAYNDSRCYQHMMAFDKVLRQLAANWLDVQDGNSSPSWDYPLTIPVGQLLAQAELRPEDIEYINAAIAHVVIARTDETGRKHTAQELKRLNREVANDQRETLRAIFKDLDRGLTLDMVNGLHSMLPVDTEAEYIIRPVHLPAIRVLHILLLRCGFWPKQFQDEELNLTEAGYDPTAIPEITNDNLDRAYVNREGVFESSRPRINDISTFMRKLSDDPNDSAYATFYGSYSIDVQRALDVLATLVDSGLAAFHDAYWQFTEQLEG